MKFELLVLGANSATPLHNRFPSCFVLNHNEAMFIIDCGEGAQIKMSQYKVKGTKVDHIFISHLHGDHIFGLPGLINSYNLNRRTNTLTVFGPVGIKGYILNVLQATGAKLNYPLKFVELDSQSHTEIVAFKNLRVSAFPLKHRIATYGYRFDEIILSKNIDPAAINRYKLTIEEIKKVKLGEDLNRDGRVILNKELTVPNKPARAFAYCSDTIYDIDIVPYINKATTIYHEATYLHELKELAKERYHSTAYEAADIADRAQVNKLLIGHYSSRYKNLEPLLDEARSKFKNTHLALEGLVFDV